MIGPTADDDRGLLELAQAGHRLAGVEDLHPGALDRLDVARGQGGDARQPAEKVQRGALGGEDARGRTVEPRDHVALAGLQRDVEAAEHRSGDV